MAKNGMTDKDLGMKKILEEMKKLGKLQVAFGFPKDSGTVKKDDKEIDIATYATWNHDGLTSSKNMLKKGKLWRLPPRPFLTQAVDNNKAQIEELGKKLVGQVCDGKIDAYAVTQSLAGYGVDITRKSIADGNFEKNSDITIHGLGVSGKARQKGERWLRTKDGEKMIPGKGKGKKPLTDSGKMKESVNAVILENGVPIGRVK